MEVPNSSKVRFPPQSTRKNLLINLVQHFPLENQSHVRNNSLAPYFNLASTLESDCSSRLEESFIIDVTFEMEKPIIDDGNLKNKEFLAKSWATLKGKLEFDDIKEDQQDLDHIGFS